MGSHVRPAINRSPREKSRTGGAAFASLNRRPRRRRLLTVPRIRRRSAMLAASPSVTPIRCEATGPRRLPRGETCRASKPAPVELAAAGLHARGHFKLGDPLCFHRLGELLGDVIFARLENPFAREKLVKDFPSSTRIATTAAAWASQVRARRPKIAAFRLNGEDARSRSPWK